MIQKLPKGTQRLLNSSSVQVALGAILLSILLYKFPGLEQYKELIQYIIVLALALIGKTGLEDAAAKWNARPPTPQEAVKEIVEQAAETLTENVKTE